MATCKTCNGNGSVKCPTCKGHGRIVPAFGSPYTCKNCDGSGVVKCGVCKGKGSVQAKEVLVIKYEVRVIRMELAYPENYHNGS